MRARIFPSVLAVLAALAFAAPSQATEPSRPLGGLPCDLDVLGVSLSLRTAPRL